MKVTKTQTYVDQSYFENRVIVNGINLNHRMSPLKHMFSKFDYALATMDRNHGFQIVGINKKTRKIDSFNRLVNKVPWI